jgi:hypothetical protein
MRFARNDEEIRCHCKERSDVEISKKITIIDPASKYLNSVIPACPESFLEFNLLRCLIPEIEDYSL